VYVKLTNPNPDANPNPNPNPITLILTLLSWPCGGCHKQWLGCTRGRNLQWHPSRLSRNIQDINFRLVIKTFIPESQPRPPSHIVLSCVLNLVSPTGFCNPPPPLLLLPCRFPLAPGSLPPRFPFQSIPTYSTSD